MEINEEYINDYVRAAQKGDKEIHEALLKKYECLIKSVINKIHFSYKRGGQGIEMDDLIQVGLIGLNKSILDYDFRKNVKFTTWATINIKSEISRYIRDTNLGMRVSRGAKELYKDYKQKKVELMDKLGREPNLREIAAELNVNEVNLNYIIRAYEVSSLDINQSILNDGKEVQLKDMAEYAHSYPEQDIILDKIMIEKAISILDDISQIIIKKRYFEEKSQAEIAKLIGKSQMYVSRKESDSREKMKDYLISVGYYGGNKDEV